MKKIVNILFVLYCLIGSSAIIKAEGHWIWDSNSKSNTWMAFRKEFVINQKSSKIQTQIAVDSKYWLWINGELIIREGGLKRTPNPYDTYVDTLDIQPYLHVGKNTIAVLVWFWGKEGHGHNSSGHGGLFFEAVNGKEKLVSDKSWKMTQHPAYDTLVSGTQPYRPLSEYNVMFDARKDIENWFSNDYDDSSWNYAKEYGHSPCLPWGNLVTRSIPQWKDYGLKEYENKHPAVSMGNILVMQLPYNCQVTPYFKIKAKEGQRVDIRTDFYTDGGGYNVRAEYITKNGIQEFECPGWLSGEQVWYCFSPEIEILELRYRESGYNTEFTGKFECNDVFFNTLWEKARRTLYVNIRDNFMDCPTRERAMWWGDVVIESLQSYYAFSPNITQLTQKAIDELINWQTEEGVLYSPIPGPHPPLMFSSHRELPLQSLAAISRLSLEYYYLFSGDKETLVKYYSAIKKYLSLWNIGEDGLVVHRDGKWNWQDWGGNIDVPLLDNTWYYSALEMAKEIAILAKCDQDTVSYNKHLRSIKKAFNQSFWKSKMYRSDTHHGETDDRGNAMAVITGIADEEKWENIKETLTTQRYASPYMEKFVLEALFKMNADKEALNRIKERYKDIVEDRTSTLPESWSYKPFSQSKNHGWSGGPLSLLMQYVAGVTPLKPNFELFSIKPQLGELTFVESEIPTHHGVIKIKVLNDDNYKITVHVPKGTEAIVSLPKEKKKGRKVYVNSIEQKHTQPYIKSGDWIIEIR